MNESCELVRSSISAALDGENPVLPSAEVESHLAGCASCSRWRTDAHEVTRQFRLQGAEVPRMAPEALLARLREVHKVRRRPAVSTARWALVVVAIGQVVVNLHLMISGDIDGFRDLGALEMALGIGYFVAAVRPKRAAGMRAIVGTAALLLIGSAVIDLMAHRTTAWDEAPHLITLAGWLLVTFVASQTPETGLPPSSRASLANRSRVMLTKLARRSDADPWSGAAFDGSMAISEDRQHRIEMITDGYRPDVFGDEQFGDDQRAVG